MIGRTLSRITLCGATKNFVQKCPLGLRFICLETAQFTPVTRLCSFPSPNSASAIDEIVVKHSPAFHFRPAHYFLRATHKLIHRRNLSFTASRASASSSEVPSSALPVIPSHIKALEHSSRTAVVDGAGRHSYDQLLRRAKSLSVAIDNVTPYSLATSLEVGACNRTAWREGFMIGLGTELVVLRSRDTAILFHHLSILSLSRAWHY